MTDLSGTEIDYRLGNRLDLDRVVELYRLSTLGERRPIQDLACMQRMLDEADVLVSGWDGPDLVGIARSLTDFCYVAYLADLAVRVSHQRRGIGRELVRRTRAALGPQAMIVLLAAPAAETYYPHIGFEHHPQAWILRRSEAAAA
ncbi:MAG: GNAT family N-acetyltransferase [Anaerolineales bacterium]